MCGIAGVVGFTRERPAGEKELSAMLRTLVHRGPDDQGMYLDEHAALGIRRLSIIDVEGGHQPIHNEDESVWVVLNGEIYNHPSLRTTLGERGHLFYTKSDTEIIVHAYEEWGEGCVEHLNGMFAFALWDRKAQKLLLARDRAGIKPLHYWHGDGVLVFGSELKALLAHPRMPRELDLSALNQYLTYEHIPVPRTIFRGIKKLPPGHLLTFRQGEISLKSYWDMALAQSERASQKSLPQWREEFLGTLGKAVEMEMVSDVPLGVFLSGGIDSSAVAAMMAGASSQTVKSFSIAFEDPSFDESSYARRAAQDLGTEHHEMVLSQRMMWELVPQIMDILDEPFGDSSIIPTYLLAKFARGYVTVALGGDGGDELLAGYSTLQAHRLAGYYLKLPALLREGLIAPLVRRLPVSMDNISLDFRAKRFVEWVSYPPPVRHHLWLGSFSPQEKGLLLRPWVLKEVEEDTFRLARELWEMCPAQEELNKLLYLDMKLYLDTDILTKVDRASMACSLEARVPFLNQVMLELAAQMPLELKLNGFTRKYLLRQAMEGLLPPEIVGRSKKGFNIPVAKWIRGELKSLVQEVFSQEKIEREGLFNYDYVKRLLEEHWEGRRDNRKLIWTLLVFELWYDKYMRG